jgi:hypothetical protein
MDIQTQPMGGPVGKQAIEELLSFFPGRIPFDHPQGTEAGGQLRPGGLMNL